ncbi:PREDICTED: uncharacterized protein LOC104715379 [Camelina sativa]|uniref:Uncharacterized protein LOC104715379 n=1 Tax=Camelina sativa TaxID=90675 RepID=A0ABM0TTF4_CAMSA|nr:PREDICTED: uncharacterized protein LOC104715379 [Camelina sativa]
MVFYRTTTVKPCDDFPARVSEKYFQEFLTILAGKIDKQVLFDVVGQIAGVGSLDNVNTKGKDNVKISSDLQDLNGDRLSCTIWGDLARNFEASIKEHEDSVVVCVIRFACLKEWKGNYSVSNAFNTTDIHLNPSIPKVEKFRQMMPNTSVVDLVHNEDEAKNIQPKLFVGKKADELVSQIAEDDLNIMPISLSALIGKTVLFKISITIDNLKSDKASYVVEIFWEKEDMVNQFVKEIYGKVNDNYQELEPAEQILQLTSEESTSLSSKREMSRINEEVVRVPTLLPLMHEDFACFIVSDSESNNDSDSDSSIDESDTEYRTTPNVTMMKEILRISVKIVEHICGTENG